MSFFKKRTKADVKSKKPFRWGNKTKSGKEAKSGTTVTFKDGTSTTLLTPSGQGQKYAAELAMNVAITNDGEFKKKNGKEVQLTEKQRAYRGGFLACLKACAKAYNAKKAAKAARKNSSNKD